MLLLIELWLYRHINIHFFLSFRLMKVSIRTNYKTRQGPTILSKFFFSLYYVIRNRVCYCPIEFIIIAWCFSTVLHPSYLYLCWRLRVKKWQNRLTLRLRYVKILCKSKLSRLYLVKCAGLFRRPLFSDKDPVDKLSYLFILFIILCKSKLSVL